MQKNSGDGQLSLFARDFSAGRTCLGHTAARKEKISSKSSSRSLKLKNHTFMLLSLQPGAGNMLGPCWEYDPAWLGPPGTLNTSECPSDVVESSLSQILLDSVPSKYYLSEKSCRGILKRADKRGKKLPEKLELALKLQAGIFAPNDYFIPSGEAFHINPRDERIDLGGVSGALMATQNMQMQTFVTQEKCSACTIRAANGSTVLRIRAERCLPRPAIRRSFTKITGSTGGIPARMMLYLRCPPAMGQAAIMCRL